MTAPWLMVLPLSTTALRLPTAFVATLNVVFVYVLARRMCGRTSIALLAGALLALTPAHFLMGQEGQVPREKDSFPNETAASP